jgi:ComF family protein
MKNAPVPNEHLCFRCDVTLPRTDFHLQKENTFTNRLWGRLDLHTAAAMFLLTHNGLAENIIYNIKYKDATDLAITLGKQYGRVLKKAPLYQDIDLIVPVPIHSSKMRTRGYNQSAVFGKGISATLEVPCHENALFKKRKTKSQTKKSRMERLVGVEGEYAVKEAEMLKGKNVLLVDDVMTTGATIESCALEILKVEGTRVSMATIGIKDF